MVHIVLGCNDKHKAFRSHLVTLPQTNTWHLPGGRAPNGEGVLIWKAITINIDHPKIILSWKFLGQKGSNDFIL